MIQRIPKPIRIAITVLLSLVIIFGIAFLIFSHTPTYFRLRYPSIDDRMSEYPTITAKVPSDFVSRTKHGITIKAPSDCVNPKESNIAPFKSDYLSIYWTWTNTLGQIALKTNSNGLLDGIPVVEMTTDTGTESAPTDKALVLKYLKDNKSRVFKDLDILSGLTEEQKTAYDALETDEAKANYLAEVDTDTWIDKADERTYFDLLSEGYNNADFSIGTNLDYFMIEVTVKSGE